MLRKRQEDIWQRKVIRVVVILLLIGILGPLHAITVGDRVGVTWTGGQQNNGKGLDVRDSPNGKIKFYMEAGQEGVVIDGPQGGWWKIDWGSIGSGWSLEKSESGNYFLLPLPGEGGWPYVRDNDYAYRVKVTADANRDNGLAVRSTPSVGQNEKANRRRSGDKGWGVYEDANNQSAVYVNTNTNHVFWRIRWDGDKVWGWSEDSSLKDSSHAGGVYLIPVTKVLKNATISVDKTTLNQGENITVTASVFVKGESFTCKVEWFLQDASGNWYSKGQGSMSMYEGTNSFSKSFSVDITGQLYCGAFFWIDDDNDGRWDPYEPWLAIGKKSITVNPTPEGKLEVTPSEGLNASGPQGGPFSPSSKQYTLRNVGGKSINWSATADRSWVTVSPSSGSLSPGSTTTVTVSINSNANSLSPGNYTSTVSFTNTTNGLGNTSRTVQLTVQQTTVQYTLYVRSSPVTGITIGGVDPNNSTWQQITDFSRTYSQGARVVLVPSPHHNRQDIQPITPLLVFDRWEGVDQTEQGVIAYVTMNSNRTVTAYYGQITDLSGNPGRLNIEAPNVVQPGSEFTLTIKGQYTGTKNLQCKIQWILDVSGGQVFNEDVTIPPGLFSFSRKIRAVTGSGRFENVILLWIDRNNNGIVNADERLAQETKIISVSQQSVPVTIKTDFEGQVRIKVNGTEYVVPVDGLTLYWTPDQEYTIEFPEQKVTVSGGTKLATRQKGLLELILYVIKMINNVIPSKHVTLKEGNKDNEVIAKVSGTVPKGELTIKPNKKVTLTVKVVNLPEVTKNLEFFINNEKLDEKNLKLLGEEGFSKEYTISPNDLSPIITLRCRLNNSLYKFIGWEFNPDFQVTSNNNGSIISFRLTHNTTITAKFTQSTESTSQGQYIIEGKITDIETGEPIPHVVVVIGNNAAETDIDGSYKIGFNGESASIVTYAPRRLWRQSDGQVVSYLSPVAGGQRVYLKPKKDKNGNLTFKIESEDTKGIGHEWTDYYIQHVFPNKDNIRIEEVKKDDGTIEKKITLNMCLIPIKLSLGSNDYNKIIELLIKYGKEYGKEEHKIPPHILLGIALQETWIQQFDTYDYTGILNLDDNYTMMNRSTNYPSCLDRTVQLTDSGIGMMQITGLTALQYLGEKKKLNLYDYKEVIKGLQQLASDVEENIKAGVWKLLKYKGNGSLSSWEIAIQQYSNRANYGDELRNKIENKISFPKNFINANDNRKNNNLSYFEPITISKSDWWLAKDSDFDGKLDGWNKDPNDPNKKRMVKRQGNIEEQEPNNTPEEANTVQWGFIDGQISPEGDVDWFKFMGQEGQRIVIRVVPIGDETTGETPLDPRIVLYDENLTPLASNDDDWWIEGEVKAAVIRGFRLPNTGTYYLKVEDIVGRGGDNYFYFMELKRELEDEYGDTLSTANPVNLGQTISGYLGHEGDVDVFRFEIQASSAITAWLTTEGDYSMELILTDENGNWLAVGDFIRDEKSRKCGWKISKSLPSAGTYYLIVRCDPPDQAGEWLSYNLDVKAAILPQPVVNAEPIVKELKQGESDQVTFTIGNQGELPFEFQIATISHSEESPSKMVKASRLAPVFIPIEVVSRMTRKDNEGQPTRLKDLPLEGTPLPSILNGHPVVVIPYRGGSRLTPSRQAPPTGTWQLLYAKRPTDAPDSPTSFSRIWMQRDRQNLYFRFTLSGNTFEMDKNFLVAILAPEGNESARKVAFLGLDRAEIWSWNEETQQFQTIGSLSWWTVNGNQVEIGIPQDVLGSARFSAFFLIVDMRKERLEFDFVPNRGWIDVPNLAWLQVEAVAGEVQGNEVVSITLKLETDTLSVGEHHASLLVLQQDFEGSILKEIPIRVTVQPPQLPFERGPGLFMVSLPISVDRQWHEILGIPEDQMKLAIYLPQENRYLLYNELAPEQRKPKPGVGVWIKLDNSVQTTVTGVPPKASEPFVINLYPGWQIIGVPWQVKWANLKVRKGNEELPISQAAERGWVYEILWTWDDQVGDYQMVWAGVSGLGFEEMLRPLMGYWILALEECQLVIPPKSEASRGVTVSRKRLAENGFVFGLMADDGRSKRRVWLGFSNEALGRGQNRQGVQAAMPPEAPEPSGIQVFALGANGKPLAADIRLGMTRKIEWDIVVRWDQKGSRGLWSEGRQGSVEEVRLTWEGLGYLPKGMSAFLVDMTTGTRRYLRTQSVYQFKPQPTETERRFKVILEQGGTGLLRIVNLQANPVRGQGVMIQFALTKSATTQVEVLTLTGRRIAILEAGRSRQAGSHTILWRGTDGEGRRLPVGAYLLRVQAEDEEGRKVQATRTMILR
ncbi:MAG: hypothetical protein LM632_01030 [Armatimonadetes bacterium]|nr:hypothetical protein [Armatimonadota bacterium]